MKAIMEDLSKRNNEYFLSRKDKKQSSRPGFYGVITAILDDVMDIGSNADLIADIAIKVTDIIDEHNVVDWQSNRDVHNKIAQDIDDVFYDLEKTRGIKIGFESIDKIIENVITVALRRFK